MTGNVFNSRIIVVSFNMLLVFEALFFKQQKETYIHKFSTINSIANIAFYGLLLLKATFLLIGNVCIVFSTI